MNKIVCGNCAKSQGKSIEERKAMVKQLKEGLNVCTCGRSMVIRNGTLYYF